MEDVGRVFWMILEGYFGRCVDEDARVCVKGEFGGCWKGILEVIG